MNKKGRFLVAMMLLVVLTMAMFSGCKKNTETTQPATNEATQTPEKTESKNETNTATEAPKEIVKLKWYMSLNPVEPDTEKVIEELNKYTRDKIGVEIDYVILKNPDYKEKMPVSISAGEYFDICFTATWTTNYYQFVDRGAFMDITELVPQYAKETYDFVPDALWNAAKVNGKLYGVPSYKEMGWQAGFLVNSDIAKEYGIDLTKVKTMSDYTEVLKMVKEKSAAAGKEVIGVSDIAFDLLHPTENLTGGQTPGVSAVPEFNNFSGTEEVFNQYATPEFMDYCKLAHQWFKSGYTPADPVQYKADTANRDNDFKNGSLFSYVISYSPGYAESMSQITGHGVTFIPIMQPLFETRNALGGLLAISSESKYPEKALELINLLNTDKYVGTLIRHGIEGVHHSAVGDTQVDQTMGGTLTTETNGYDYVFGWQFGTPFNQKWDISYPDNIEQLFLDYNKSAIVAPHNGFAFKSENVSAEIGAITNTVAEYVPALTSGMVNPEDKMDEFLKALESNGVETVLEEIRTQIADWR